MVTHLFWSAVRFFLCTACSDSDMNPLMQLRECEEEDLLFNTPALSDPTVRSRCLCWLLCVVRRGLWSQFWNLAQTRTVMCYGGGKFRHSNLGSKHRQWELRCSSGRGDLLHILTCSTELLTALLTFKVHVCKHQFRDEVRLGMGWQVSLSVALSDGKHFSLRF